MLCNRIRQFREYNKLDATQLAEILEIDVDLYNDYENGRAIPPIHIIENLAGCYKVTIDEFYGYTPRLTLHSKDDEKFFEEDVDEVILKMADLSWDEARLILMYRNSTDKDRIIKMMSDESDEKDS